MKKLTKELLTIFAICTLACVVSACGGSANPKPTVTPTPSVAPSLAPSVSPSVLPSVAPSVAPSVVPSVAPSVAPSVLPSVAPSVSPSVAPSVAPSVVPSVLPSVSPTPSIDWATVFTVNDSGETITGVTAYGKTLSIIEIPERINSVQITKIGNFAFKNCDFLTEIVIPDSVTSIGYEAFSGCDSLRYTIAGNCKYLGNSNNPYLGLIETTSKDITEVTIHNNCEMVAVSVFYDCSYLQYTIKDNCKYLGNSDNPYLFLAKTTSNEIVNATIERGCKIIDTDAFYECTSLTEIVIPSSVTTIGEYAFSSCPSLTNIIVEANNAKYKDLDGNLYSKDGATIVRYAMGKTETSFTIPSSVITIESSAFSSCSSLTEIVIPSSVTTIREYAFDNCNSLTAVTFGENSQLTSIGDSAFENCTSLTEIVIPNSVTSIGSGAFENCTSLTEISIPNSVTNIGDDAFTACGYLTIYCEAESRPSGWGSSWNSFDRPVVWGYQYVKQNGIIYGIKDGTATMVRQPPRDNITGSLSIPTSVTYKGNTYSVTKIGEYAFSSFDFLTEIVIPESITCIGDYAFYDCDSLTEFAISNSVNSVGDYAFYHCNFLTEIVIPKGVPSIGDYAFGYCPSLTEIVIPNSVTSICDYAFYDCDSLTEIVIPESVTSIGSWVFYSCNFLTIYCEAASEPSGWDSDWNYTDCPVVWDCKNNDVATNGNIYTVQNGIRYALKDGVATVVEQSRNIAGSITIPASVTHQGNTYAVTSICDYAFYNCKSLTEIVIPNSVTSIGKSAFSGCLSLTTVTFGDNSQLTSIGERAFFDCISLTEIVIPEGVTSIGEWAFRNCSSLTEIVIPKGVTSIGYQAFSSCNSLTIYCEAESRPSRWSRNWNDSYPDDIPVVWGYTGE